MQKRQELLGVSSLLVHAIVSSFEPAQELLSFSVTEIRLEHDPLEGSVRVEEPLCSGQEGAGHIRGEDLAGNGVADRGADIHQCLTGGAVVGSRTVSDGHFIISLEEPRSEALVHRADPDHSEAIHLCGSQRAHARRAVYANSLRERPKNLLVLYRQAPLEVTIDEPDDLSSAQDRSQDVPALGGRSDHGGGTQAERLRAS